MKTRSIKTGLILIAIASVFALSSFTGATPKPEPEKIKTDWKEYHEVQQYVEENICEPIRKNYVLKHGKSSLHSFSRCPSGYHSEMITATDSVKTDRFVNGEIVFYKGCESSYICDFKVCVEKGFAVVRSKGSKNYISVNEWLQRREQYAKKTIKG